MALSKPKPAAARPFLFVPTPAVSVATTPVLETKFVILSIPPAAVPDPNPKIARPEVLLGVGVGVGVGVTGAQDKIAASPG